MNIPSLATIEAYRREVAYREYLAQRITEAILLRVLIALGIQDDDLKHFVTYAEHTAKKTATCPHTISHSKTGRWVVINFDAFYEVFENLMSDVKLTDEETTLIKDIVLPDRKEATFNAVRHNFVMADYTIIYDNNLLDIQIEKPE